MGAHARCLADLAVGGGLECPARILCIDPRLACPMPCEDRGRVAQVENAPRDSSVVAPTEWRSSFLGAVIAAKAVPRSRLALACLESVTALPDDLLGAFCSDRHIARRRPLGTEFATAASAALGSHFFVIATHASDLTRWVQLRATRPDMRFAS